MSRDCALHIFERKFARQLGYDVESLTGVKHLLLFTELDQRSNGFITSEDGPGKDNSDPS